MRLALYQPDIPQNAGAILRLGACFDVAVDIIEPCGFVFDDRKLRRAGMDYLDQARLTRHLSWEHFCTTLGQSRLILLTTRGNATFPDFAFRPEDVLLFGRESAGVPEAVHDACPIRLRVPLRPQARSLNLAMTAALVVGEALRQTGGYPGAPA